MKYILLIIFVFLSIYPFRGLKKDKTKMYQLPCLFGLVTLGMIIPTLLMNVFSVSGLSEEAFNLYIFNACLCLICAYYGYSLPVKRVSVSYRYDEKKMLIIASIFTVVCIFINLKIKDLTNGMNYDGGMPAVLSFFGNLLKPITIIVFFLFLRKFSYYRLVLVIILFGLIIFDGILARGRRSEVFMFCFIFLLPMFFVKGFIPYKKIYLIITIVAGIGVYLLLPVWRSYNLAYYGSSNLGEEANYKEELLDNLKGEKTNDILEATYTHYALLKTGERNYGAEFYNAIVQQFASKTLFGEGLKQKLYISKIDYVSIRKKVNNGEWGDFKRYLTRTGFVDVFGMFGFLGCLVFFLFARISKRIWYDAIYTDDYMHKVFYSYFTVMFICQAIYSNVFWFIVTLIQFLIVYLPVKYFSIIRRK